MQREERQIPEGMQDVLPGACAAKRLLEAALRELFERGGYTEVETPLLEHYETFDGAGVAARRIWKALDRSGGVLAIRPDNTTPIVRMAATHLRRERGEAALRLCYIQDVLAYPTEEHPRFCQTTQAGVELLGDGTPEADAEALALAIRALERSGLRDFQIDIGQMEFFAGLMEEVGLSEAERDGVRVCVEKKDMLALELMLRRYRIGAEVTRRIMQLPVLYGGEEVLEHARAVTQAPRALAALERLRRVLAVLEAQGLKRFVSVDLGMVHAIHYYTGIIFRGMTGQLGKPLLSGGRYDRLPVEFGLEMPAVGFGLDVSQTLLAVERQQQAPETERQEVMTIALAKGRLAEQTLALLERAGVDCGEARNPGRKLVLSDPSGRYRFMLVKPSDVPTYVEHGVADIGVAGKDTLLEENRPLYELLDLGLGACRLCVAGFPRGEGEAVRGNLRVATKYPNVARSYYAAKGQNIEIIKLNGSVELGPLVGLSDVILDIVESGKTLEANGLKVLETIADSSARVVVNVVSLKTKGAMIRPLIAGLARALAVAKEEHP